MKSKRRLLALAALPAIFAVGCNGNVPDFLPTCTISTEGGFSFQCSGQLTPPGGGNVPEIPS
jgi:hypothetical protein